MVKNVWRKTLKDAEIKIFVGYDSREEIAYHVCRESIFKNSKNTENIEVIPLKLKELKKSGIYTRPEDKLGSTEFTFSRFLIPHLTDFKGWALFCDCDFLFKQNVRDLFAKADDKYAVMCVHHDYTPKEETKMDGKEQHIYPRKNWSSLVLWNCSHPANKKLTAEHVNNKKFDGAYFHRFSWLEDHQIGRLSHKWNWLVGHYKQPQDGEPLALHYTEGGPWFQDYETCEYAADWLLMEKRYLKNLSPKAPKINKYEMLEDDKKDFIDSAIDYMIDPTNKYLNTSLDIVKEKMEKAMGNKVAAIDSDGGISYKSQGHLYDPILMHFIRGAKGYISNWEDEEHTDVPLVIRGLGGGSRKAIVRCKETGRTFYAVDTGYFGNGKTKWVHRITKNNLQYIGPIVEREHDRLKMFGYKYQGRKKGKKILICPPSLKVMDMFGQPSPEVWTQQVSDQLKRITKRPIEIRLKPNRTQRVTSKTIQQALNNDVHCLITYNSIAAIEAMMEGIPAIVLGQNAASAICETDLRNVDTPRFPNKETMDAFMAHLSYCQFSVPEMESGFAWRTVNETSSLPLWNPSKK